MSDRKSIRARRLRSPSAEEADDLLNSRDADLKIIRELEDNREKQMYTGFRNLEMLIKETRKAVTDLKEELIPLLKEELIPVLKATIKEEIKVAIETELPRQMRKFLENAKITIPNEINT